MAGERIQGRTHNFSQKGAKAGREGWGGGGGGVLLLNYTNFFVIYTYIVGEKKNYLRLKLFLLGVGFALDRILFSNKGNFQIQALTLNYTIFFYIQLVKKKYPRLEPFLPEVGSVLDRIIFSNKENFQIRTLTQVVKYMIFHTGCHRSILLSSPFFQELPELALLVS